MKRVLLIGAFVIGCFIAPLPVNALNDVYTICEDSCEYQDLDHALASIQSREYSMEDQVRLTIGKGVFYLSRNFDFSSLPKISIVGKGEKSVIQLQESSSISLNASNIELSGISFIGNKDTPSFNLSLTATEKVQVKNISFAKLSGSYSAFSVASPKVDVDYLTLDVSGYETGLLLKNPVEAKIQNTSMSSLQNGLLVQYENNTPSILVNQCDFQRSSVLFEKQGTATFAGGKQKNKAFIPGKTDTKHVGYMEITESKLSSVMALSESMEVGYDPIIYVSYNSIWNNKPVEEQNVISIKSGKVYYDELNAKNVVVTRKNPVAFKTVFGKKMPKNIKWEKKDDKVQIKNGEITGLKSGKYQLIGRDGLKVYQANLTVNKGFIPISAACIVIGVIFLISFVVGFILKNKGKVKNKKTKDTDVITVNPAKDFAEDLDSAVDNMESEFVDTTTLSVEQDFKPVRDETFSTDVVEKFEDSVSEDTLPVKKEEDSISDEVLPVEKENDSIIEETLPVENKILGVDVDSLEIEEDAKDNKAEQEPVSKDSDSKAVEAAPEQIEDLTKEDDYFDDEII